MEQSHDSAADAGAARAAVVRGLVNHCILQRDMPVSSVSVFRRDVLVKKRLPPGVRPSKHVGMGGERGVIKEFSMQSRYRLLHTVKNCDCDFFSMLTLTYPAEFPADGRLVKRHLEEIRRRLIKRFPGIRGIWFLEFQKRGAPHFHLLLSLKPWDFGKLVEKKRHLKKLGTKIFQTSDHLQSWASDSWFEIVGSGDEKHRRAGAAWEVIENEDGALRYAAAHSAKPHQKKVPEGFENVGRFWGVVGAVKVPVLSRAVVDAENIFEVLGPEAMSSRGRVKKYLWDAADCFGD